MRKVVLLVFSAIVLMLCVYLQAESPKKVDDAVKVRVRLVDAETGANVGGIVRVYRAGDDKPLALPGLFDPL